MPTPSRLTRIRNALAERLGIHAREARDGSWWEVDLLLVILAGSVVLGIVALVQL